MKKDDLREVVERLEALDSLAQLFKNLWFSKIKDEIQDEKVKAYLMVFEDAFPGLDRVVSFVAQNAQHLSESPEYKVKEEFEILSQALLNREIAMDLDLEDELDPDIFEEESLEDDASEDASEALGEGQAVVGQGDIDDLFADGPDTEISEVDELDNFFDDDEDEASADDLDDLLDDEDEADEEDVEDLLADEDSAEDDDDLADLLADDDDDEDAGGEDDLDDLIGADEVDDSGDDIDIDDLLGEEDEDDMAGGADISEEEMTALLDDEPSAKKAAPKAKKKSKKREVDGEDEEDMSQVSQDEIDALFG